LEEKNKIKGDESYVVFKRFLFREILFSMTLCVVVCDRTDEANMLEVSGQLPGQLVLPRVIVVMPNNCVLSKTWTDFPLMLSVLSTCFN